MSERIPETVPGLHARDLPAPCSATVRGERAKRASARSYWRSKSAASKPQFGVLWTNADGVACLASFDNSRDQLDFAASLLEDA
jgi:hypothetical protein